MGGHSRPGLDRFDLLGLASVATLSLWVRLGPAVGVDFPLNDGGLFYTMARDLEAHGFAIPAYTSYNDGTIPFAYPPAGIYLAAFASRLGFPLLDVVRILPPLIAALVPLAVYLLARRLLADRVGALLAGLIATALPGTFAWLIMGGGLTRAPGTVLAVLTLWALHSSLEAPGRPRHVLLLAVLSAATLLTHAEAAACVAVMGLASMGVHVRSVRQARDLLLAGCGAMLCALPWTIHVLNMHGAGPFGDALSAKKSDVTAAASRLLRFDYTMEPLFAVGAVLGVVGCARLLSRDPRVGAVLTGWVLSVALLQPHFATVMVPVPLAVAGGAVLAEGWRHYRARRASWRVFPWLVVWSGTVLLLGALAFPSASSYPYGPVSQADREAMSLVEREVPAGQRVLVVESPSSWGAGPVQEWFPSLTKRLSPATPQGTEWTPSFSRRLRAPFAINSCFARDITCVWGIAERLGLTFSYIFVAGTGGGPFDEATNSLIRSARRDDCLTEVFASGATRVYRVNPECSAR